MGEDQAGQAISSPRVHARGGRRARMPDCNGVGRVARGRNPSGLAAYAAATSAIAYTAEASGGRSPNTQPTLPGAMSPIAQARLQPDVQAIG